MTPGPILEAKLGAEALRDGEEVGRIHREKNDTSLESSYYESIDEDSRRRRKEKHKRGTKKIIKKGDLRSSPTLTSIAKEGKTVSPLVCLSNWFQALDNRFSSEGELEGKFPEVVVGPGGGVKSSSFWG